MSVDNQDPTPIQARINDILSSGRSSQRTFAGAELAAEVDELEYLLAKAELELRSAEGRVEELRRELQDKRGPVRANTG